MASQRSRSIRPHTPTHSVIYPQTLRCTDRLRANHAGLTIGGNIGGLTIGDRTFLNTECSLHPTGKISIGNDVSFGPRVIAMTGTHEIGPSTKRASDPTTFSPVTIGDGCWLGAGVLVSPGVTVGPGCIIAPGAVVTKDYHARTTRNSSLTCADMVPPVGLEPTLYGF